MGKAKNLRNRVRSYTNINPTQTKTHTLVQKAHAVKFQVLESELEALLTEASLIKLYQPKYNSDLKDDKSPLYIVITTDIYPRVITARKKQLATIYKDVPKNNIYGPFSSGYTARQIIKLARKVFKFCNARPRDKKAKKACFYTHINQCSGACTGQISVLEYNRMIKHLKLFLSGKKKSLLKQLKQDMHQLSQQKYYEEAAIVRDQRQALAFYYQGNKKIDFNPETPVLIEDTNQHIHKQLSQLLHTAGLVPLGYSIYRIEAYDISNTSGHLATASMVVFEDGRASKSEYRQFRIKNLQGPNDTAMLKQALARRMNHPEWTMPDLIIIDGGKGQLRASLQVINNRIPTISIAKRPDRLLIPQTSDDTLTYLELKLEPGAGITRLIQQLRDESHRFAKQYHTKLRTTHGMLK